MLGEKLVARGLVSEQDIAIAIEAQRRRGGALGQILLAMGKISEEQLSGVLNDVPAEPMLVDELGIPLPELLDLMVKALHGTSIDSSEKLAEFLQIPRALVSELTDEARERQLLEILGVSAGGSQLRFSLSGKGRDWAQQALDKNAYIGPVPVSLEDFTSRIRKQSIGTERIPPELVHQALRNLVMSDYLTKQIGPAVNSGRSILLYGPPGNGKTSVAERIGRIFEKTVYVPYAFTVGGQIIKVFDPAVHAPAQPAVDNSDTVTASIRRRGYDRRWVPCRRPFVVTGGELTLEMLDLSYNGIAKFYEAPLHVKALNGIFLIDDFGRQIVAPELLLNRWIVPLESRVDYLKLHTGKSFKLPFDELVIFSTNLAPSQLMDPAFLRRIPYKIEVGSPSREDYREIFRIVARAQGVSVSEEMVEFAISEIADRHSLPLAGYQPGFILSQVIAACKYLGIDFECDREKIEFAIANIYTKDSSGYGIAQRSK